MPLQGTRCQLVVSSAQMPPALMWIARTKATKTLACALVWMFRWSWRTRRRRSAECCQAPDSF